MRNGSRCSIKRSMASRTKAAEGTAKFSREIARWLRQSIAISARAAAATVARPANTPADGRKCAISQPITAVIAAIFARLIQSCRRPNFASARVRDPASTGAMRGGWCRHSSWSCSNCAMVDLRHHIFEDLLDARNLHPHVVDRNPRDVRDLAVAQAFQQQAHDEAVLVGQGGYGGPQGGQALLLLEVLLRPAALVRNVGELLSPFSLPPIDQCRVHGAAIQPGVARASPRNAGRLFQALVMISWKRSSTSSAEPR